MTFSTFIRWSFIFYMCVISTVHAADRNCTNIASWERDKTYQSGEQVKQLGIIYTARWWTQGDAPATHHQKNHAWQKQGKCQQLTIQQEKPIQLQTNIRQPSLLQGQRIDLSAHISAPAHKVQRVEFYYNNQLIGERFTAPYMLSYTPHQLGRAHFYARLVFIDNSSYSSQTLKYRVQNDPLALAPELEANVSCQSSHYKAGNSYKKGDRVQHQGQVYRCEVAGWCSQKAAWAYTPGTGDHWQQAWLHLKHCGQSSPNKQPCQANRFILGNNYDDGDQVRYQGKAYQCLVGGWCSQKAEWAYTPGTGEHWQQAWKVIAICP